tara:strand:- start:3599 stop:6604 length:3006 start_codon:yes stop_codon:yes gene_type:complete
MSINKVYKNKNNLDFVRYDLLINKFKRDLSSNLSNEKHIAKESNIIKYIEEVLKVDLDELTEFHQLELKDIVMVENIIKDNVSLGIAQVNFINSKFGKYNNEIKLLLNGIIGKIKRIKQKESALNLWDDVFVKYAIAEKFNNFDQIDFSMVSGNKLNLEVDQGVLTLPITKQNKINISSVKILSGNGNAGNSDIDVDYSSSSLNNLIDGKMNSWFEYEKLDNGPVQLKLFLELEKEDIVNYIELYPYFIDGSFEIEDIEFSGNARDYQSVKNLTVVENDSFYTPKEVSGGSKWNINFLPIKCKNIVFTFSSNFTNYIKAAGVNGTNERKRFFIGLREIVIKKIKYANEGSLNSTNLKLIDTVYTGNVKYKCIPENENLYNIKIDVSTDGGRKWSENKKSFLVEDEKDFVYKLFIKRNNESFSNSISYLKKAENSTISIKKKMCSKKISPNILNINEKILEEDIFVFQETGVKLTDNIQKALTIHSYRRAKKAELVNLNRFINTFKVNLPFSLIDYNLQPSDIKILVNDTFFEETREKEDLNEDENTYYLSENLDSIYLSKDRVERNSKIKFFLKPEELSFYKREKRFYCRFKNYFNPSKNSIKIESLSSISKRHIERINKSKRIIRLSKTGIDPTSIKFTASDSHLTFTPTSKAKVKKSGQAIFYHFNEEKSILFLPIFNVESGIKVEYECNPLKTLENDEYKVWLEEGEVKGIYIEDKDFVSEDVEEKLSLTFNPLRLFSLKERKFIERNDLFLNNRRNFTLSNKNIVGGTVRLSPGVFGKPNDYELSPIEVPFIDGETEFLNLKKITNEKTNSIYSGSNGLISFTLSAGELFYSKIEPIFSGNEFITKRNALSDLTDVGDYYISPVGLVTLKLNPDVYSTGDINIEYYYAENKKGLIYSFSVDYVEGVLYLSENLSSENYDKTIKYKTSTYAASYEIVDKIKDFKYNSKTKKIEVEADALNESSNTLSVAYLVKDTDISLEELKEYFTPFVDKLDFRFS